MPLASSTAPRASVTPSLALAPCAAMAIVPERACTVVATSTLPPSSRRRPPAALSVEVPAVPAAPASFSAEYTGLAGSRRSAACQVCTAPAATPTFGVVTVHSPPTASEPAPWPTTSLSAFIDTEA